MKRLEHEQTERLSENIHASFSNSAEASSRDTDVLYVALKLTRGATRVVTRVATLMTFSATVISA
jgi:hypothetical protein